MELCNLDVLVNNSIYEMLVTPLETTSYTILNVTDQFCVNDEPGDQIEIIVDPLPYVYAGLDDTICESEVFVLGSATSSYATVFNWEVYEGAGSFSNPSELNATFDPDNITNPSLMTLVIHATGDLECSNEVVTDTIHLFVEPLPNMTAGNDLTICENDTLWLNGAMAEYAPVTNWEVVPGSTGYFLDPLALNAYYVPGDVTEPTVMTVVLHGMGTSKCIGQEATDTLEILDNPLPEIDAGPDLQDGGLYPQVTSPAALLEQPNSAGGRLLE